MRMPGVGVAATSRHAGSVFTLTRSGPRNPPGFTLVCSVDEPVVPCFAQQIPPPEVPPFEAAQEGSG